MKKYLAILCFALAPFMTKAQNGSFDEKAKNYVQQYAAWAIEEQQRVGIPAAITLAQGIYETGAGESELATQANNHFGIKCKKEWQGETYAHTDDAPNECFRKYASAKESYTDHSNYLVTSKRYAELFTYEQTNYIAWAKGLRKCGYATNPAYASKLIKMVEDYDLQQYTLAASASRVNEVVPTKEVVVDNTPKVAPEVKTEKDGDVYYNDLRAVYCKRGENLLEVAMKNNIRYAKLLDINELQDEPLQRDMYLYLEPKRNKGSHVSYVVQEGETIDLIAHKEGMNSRQLRIFNLLAQNEEPVAGSILKLQMQADDRPATYKVTKEDRVKSKSNIRLMDVSKKANDNDFIPTKNVEPVQNNFANKIEEPQQAVEVHSVPVVQNKTEEIEMGYGAERPAFLQEQPNKAPEQVATQPMKQETNEMVNTKAEAVEEIPEEPLDEFEQLKRKLDKAVYSKTSKSNIKVSSTDAAAISANENKVTKTAAKENIVAPNAEYHTVTKGETGYGIAKKFGISIKQLNEWNGLNFDGIKVGQKLRVK